MKELSIQKILLGLLAAATLWTWGCGGGPSNSSSTIPSPSPSPGAATQAAFEVVISTQYENNKTGPVTTQADCSIPSGSASGTTLACTNTVGAVNSTVAIPEGQLYFSNLSFTVNVGAGSAANGCTRAIFTPYTYVASNSNNKFSAPWTGTSSVDCTQYLTTAGCWGGLAADIVGPKFPQFRAIYFSTANQLTASYTAQSANSHTFGSNRYSVNNLAIRNVSFTFNSPTPSGDAFDGVPTDYQDYVFDCADQWAQPVYQITLTLTDVDLSGTYPNSSQGNAAINQYPDWDPASWDR